MMLLLLACTGDPPAATPVVGGPVPEEPSVSVPGPSRPALKLPPGGGGLFAQRLEPLQGRWQSVSDAKAELLIVKSIWVEGYDGVEQKRAAMEWADGCRADGGQPSPSGQYLNLLSEAGPRCLQVRTVSEERLELIELPDAGVLEFVRAASPGM